MSLVLEGLAMLHRQRIQTLRATLRGAAEFVDREGSLDDQLVLTASRFTEKIYLLINEVTEVEHEIQDIRNSTTKDDDIPF